MLNCWLVWGLYLLEILALVDGGKAVVKSYAFFSERCR